MKNYTYDNFNQDVAKYIELNLLPHLLAFSFAMLYSHHMLEEESFDRYYNSIRSLVNVIGENKALVQTIIDLNVFLFHHLSLKKSKFFYISFSFTWFKGI